MIATVSTVKDTLANVQRFVRGNLAGGVDHMVVFLDAPDAEVEAWLAGQEHVTHLVADDAWWGGKRPADLNDRQRLHANITKAVLTVTPDAKTKVYDNKVYTNSLPFTSTITGFFGSDTLSDITGVPTYSGTATTGTVVGSYTITSVIGAMSAANYTFASANGTLTITKAVLIATPDAKTKVYNSAVFSGYSTTYTGCKINIKKC